MDNSTFRRIEGIWHFLAPEQRKRYARFVHEYDVVRTAEAWGSDQEAYYRALPYRDLSGQHSYVWHIRATSYRRCSSTSYIPWRHSAPTP